MGSNAKSIWRESAAVERLKELIGECLTASQIAAHLSREFAPVTRNAVIGKTMRMGLALAGKPKRAPVRRNRAPAEQNNERKTRRLRRSTVNANLTIIFGNRFQLGTIAAEPLPKELPADAIPISQRKTILELRACHCRFVYGDPRGDYFFCGGATVGDSSYCAFHWAVTHDVAKTVASAARQEQMEDAA